jgi:hypothetical protein
LEVGRFGAKTDHLLHQAEKFVFGLCETANRLLHSLVQALLAVENQRQVQIILVLEIEIDGPLGNACLSRNVIEEDLMEVSLAKQTGSGIDDAIPTLRFVSPHCDPPDSQKREPGCKTPAILAGQYHTFSSEISNSMNH